MNFKTMSPITILIIITLVLVGTVGVIYAFGQLTINGSGTVVASIAAVTVYPTSFDWGPMVQGTSKNITLTLTNNGGTDTSPLLINTLMPTGLTLDHDGGSPILAHSSRDIIFTLTASTTAPTVAFTHTVTIDG